MQRKKEHRQVFQLIKSSHIVLEVIDSRFPLLSRVSTVENFTKELGIPLIIVINKCDLVPREVCDVIISSFNKEFPSVYVSSQKRLGTKKLREKIHRYARKREETLVSIVGIPNTGKSSLINVLRGKHVARTGQKPGVTRHTQAIRMSRKILMYDTPGIIPFDHPDKDLHTFMGASSIDIVEDPVASVHYFLNRIKSHHPEGIAERYGLPKLDMTNDEILSYIAQNRGFLGKGGVPNIIEVSKMVMREFTAGDIPYWEKI